MEIERKHWENVKRDNENLRLECLIKLEMTQEMIKLCDLKISEFPPEEPKPERQPLGV